MCELVLRPSHLTNYQLSSFWETHITAHAETTLLEIGHTNVITQPSKKLYIAAACHHNLEPGATSRRHGGVMDGT